VLAWHLASLRRNACAEFIEVSWVEVRAKAVGAWDLGFQIFNQNLKHQGPLID
jgi:hypothetical protein